MKILFVSLAILFLGIGNFFATEPPGGFKPKDGFVPDEKTAIAIAVAVWLPIYGEKQITSEKPFKATLKDGVWHVTGSLPKGWYGGVAEADISKENGRILHVIHGE